MTPKEFIIDAINHTIEFIVYIAVGCFLAEILWRILT